MGDERSLVRAGAWCAGAVAVLSVVYAIAYLGITPSEQRSGDIDEFFASYAGDPWGMRLASVSLLLSGLAGAIGMGGLYARLKGTGAPWLHLGLIVAGVACLASAAHGLGDILAIEEWSDRWTTGIDAEQAAIRVAFDSPSPVDPRGLATFGLAGLVALLFAVVVRREHRRLGTIGLVLGVDLVVLFLATLAGIDPLILLTGGAAALVLNPLWWGGVARLLWRSTAGGAVLLSHDEAQARPDVVDGGDLVVDQPER